MKPEEKNIKTAKSTDSREAWKPLWRRLHIRADPSHMAPILLPL